MPAIVPPTSDRNFTPSSTELSGPLSAMPGAADDAQIVKLDGCDTVTVVPALGVSRLPLSSTARLLIVTVPELAGVQANVQLSRPPTTPPPVSVAVPLMVTAVPCWKVAPATGEVIDEVGGRLSVEAEAATRPACSVAGWTPISASKFTVACCIRTSVVEPR